MKTTLRHLWSLALGILPLVALCALADSARAGCGSYVQVLSHPSGEIPESHRMPSGQRGPSCDRVPQSPVPMSAPAVTVAPPLGEAILIEPGSQRTDANSSRRRIPTDEFAARVPSDSIFQPPRG